MACRGTGEHIPDRDLTGSPGLENCPSCGALNNADAAFCSQCGFELGLDTEDHMDFEEFEEGLEDEGPEPAGFVGAEEADILEEDDLREGEDIIDGRRLPPPGPPKGRGPGPLGPDPGRRNGRMPPPDIRRMPPPTPASARGAPRPGAQPTASPQPPKAPPKPIDYKVKREQVMTKFTMYLMLIGLVNLGMSLAMGRIMAGLKLWSQAYLGHLLLNVIMMGVLIGIALYAGRMSDRSQDRTSAVEAKNLGRVYGGIGIILTIFIIQVFGVHRAVPGIPDPGNYNSEWSVIYVMILLPGLVLLIKGLYAIREKLSYYKIWKNGIWLLVLAPITGSINSLSPVVKETGGTILNYQPYFSYSVSSIFIIMVILAFMLKGYLDGLYRSLEEETTRGEDLFKAGRYREAMQRFDNAIDIGHDLFSQYFYDIDSPRVQVRLPAQYGIPWLRKGDTLIQLNRPRKAIAIYDVILELDPKNEVVWNRKGEVLLSMNKPQDAIRCFDLALSAVPNYAKAVQNKQKALAMQRDMSEEAVVIIDD